MKASLFAEAEDEEESDMFQERVAMKSSANVSSPLHPGAQTRPSGKTSSQPSDQLSCYMVLIVFRCVSTFHVSLCRLHSRRPPSDSFHIRTPLTPVRFSSPATTFVSFCSTCISCARTFKIVSVGGARTLILHAALPTRRSVHQDGWHAATGRACSPQRVSHSWEGQCIICGQQWQQMLIFIIS